MHEHDELKAAMDEWNAALDTGDLERLVACCAPEVVICNERQPLRIGLQAIRDKYRPRVETSTFRSSVPVEAIRLFGDFAVLVTAFDVEATDKSSGQKRYSRGRLVIGYPHDAAGRWKMALDVDNNDLVKETSA